MASSFFRIFGGVCDSPQRANASTGKVANNSIDFALLVMTHLASPRRNAQSRIKSVSHVGRVGLNGCVRPDGIRPVKCKKIAAECLYAGTSGRNATLPRCCNASE